MRKRADCEKQERITRKPLAIDLFCGCGGTTLGLKSAGFRIIGAVDNDSLAVLTYKANHSQVYVWDKDIKDLSTQAVKRKLSLRKGELDLLAGCPPCQGFSTMRTLNGFRSVDDPRNDLIRQFYRFVKDLLPKAVMLENVPGLARDERFKSFCEKMEDLGYRGKFDILDAADYGVPQRRRRLIYLAGRDFEINFAAKSDEKRTVGDVIRDMPAAGKSGDPVHDLPEKRSPEVLKRIRAIPQNGGSRRDLPEIEQLECHKKCNGFKDVYGRMAWEEVAPTLTSGCFNPSKGRFLHPEEDRAITMREAALLQGFPSRYRFPLAKNKSALALLIGNALPPPFIASHARSILGSLNARELRE
jgi:DNA (cytosine-5)-methyltransferase 1